MHSCEFLPYQPCESFVRVATACPEVAVGEVPANVARIAKLYAEGVERQASLVVFPELSLTGYSIGDFVQHKLLLENAKAGLQDLVACTDGTQTTMVVGLPLMVGNSLYNCAAVLAGGRIRGIVPKSNLPGSGEFYEPRWYSAWEGENAEVCIGGQAVPVGTDMLFEIGDTAMGVEICEDLWVATPLSTKLAAAGATIIANPSASPEHMGRSATRRAKVADQADRIIAAYVYASADPSESTTDNVMSGHQLIAENGKIITERPALSLGQRLTVVDVDIDHIRYSRRQNRNYPNGPRLLTIDCGIAPQQADLLRDIDPTPFIPKGPEATEELEHALNLQAQALVTRMRKTGIKKVVLGLSGGLDSTLALLAALRACKRMGKTPAEVIHAITMPGEASSAHTQSNAEKLALAVGVEHSVIAIGTLAEDQLRALGHDTTTQDVTYENTQARLRTAILFNRANQLQGLVLGTGNMSESALGFCTFNGDHMSHYNVNAGVPKTLVRELVAHAAATQPGEVQVILQSILDTPISPELTNDTAGGIGQHTESLIGPYILHDFFLYYFLRHGDKPKKIEFLAARAFEGRYESDEITHWLDVFVARVAHSQWKRSVMPDGPKIVPVSFSPRGDWRMPSDMSVGALQ